MKRRTFVAGVAGTAGLALSAAACSSTTTPTPGASGAAGGKLSGSLEVGVLPAEGTAGFTFLQGIGNGMMKDNPDLKITYTFANTKVRPMMEQRWRAGSPPDLDYFVFNAQVPKTYEFKDKLLDLTPYLAEPLADGSGTWGSSFIDGTKSVTQLDGATYGVVTDAHLITLFYNKTIFDKNGIKPPETWDQVVEAGRTLKAAGVAPIAVTGMFEPYMGFWVDDLFQREVGYEKARQAAFSGDYSDAGFLRAAEKIQTIRDQGFFMPGFKGTDFTAAQMAFFQGKAGMILVGTWLSSEMKDAIPADFKLGVTGFPTVPGAAGDQDAQLSHSNIMVVNKAGKNIPAAVEYMKRLTSKETQTRRATETGTVSAVKGVPVPPGVEGLGDVISKTKTLNVRYFGLEFIPDRNTAYYREVAKFFSGEYGSQQFLDALSASMKRLPK